MHGFSDRQHRALVGEAARVFDRGSENYHEKSMAYETFFACGSGAAGDKVIAVTNRNLVTGWLGERDGRAGSSGPVKMIF